ncbi:hypothetical protein [Clostridium massiliamazoniense]|uniref:hypothetical protein n=1 Tax=Clostridium massiliamazoniense TaxID=1347366 RepID=UPI0006D7B559|nr:hypothetical protein [Clostridium massiliamazoniense]
MTNKMQLWKEYIEKNINEEIDVDLELLRVSIISVNGKSISEYFTFQEKIQVVEFLKEVVLPSIVLSLFFEDKDPSIYLWSKEEVNEFLEVNSGFLHRKLLKLYLNSYDYIDNIMSNDITEVIVNDLVRYLEHNFEVYNLVFLGLSYGENTDSYLKNIMELYKEKNLLDVLERDLNSVNLSIEKLNSIIDNIYEHEKEIKEEVLNKIPIGI